MMIYGYDQLHAFAKIHWSYLREYFASYMYFLFERFLAIFMYNVTCYDDMYTVNTKYVEQLYVLCEIRRN